MESRAGRINVKAEALHYFWIDFIVYILFKRDQAPRISVLTTFVEMHSVDLIIFSHFIFITDLGRLIQKYLNMYVGTWKL